MITSTHHSGFVVKNLDSTVEFYRDVMGLKVSHTFDLEGEESSKLLGYDEVHVKGALLSADSGHMLEFLEYINPRPTQRASEERNVLAAGHFAFAVDDIDRTYLDLTSRGMKGLNPPIELAPGVKACYAQDPDGNWIELLELSE